MTAGARADLFLALRALDRVLFSMRDRGAWCGPNSTRHRIIGLYMKIQTIWRANDPDIRRTA